MYRIIYNWIILHFIRLGLREKHIFCHFSLRRSLPFQRHVFHPTYNISIKQAYSMKCT